MLHLARPALNPTVQGSSPGRPTIDSGRKDSGGKGWPLRELNREERLLLLKFVCSFAWADLEVRPEERAFVARLIRKLALDADERREVEGWLERPPAPEEVDPALVPREHRRVFVQAIESLIAADGEIAEAEREQLLVFAKLVR